MNLSSSNIVACLEEADYYFKWSDLLFFYLVEI